jgi:hypothetical protein
VYIENDRGNVAMYVEISKMGIETSLREASMPDEALFPELERWMIQNPDAARKLSLSTRERYLKGGVPAPFLWFFENPGAFDAIATDVRQLTPQQLSGIRGQVKARSSKQQKYRAKGSAEGSAVEAVKQSRKRKAS